MENLVKRLHHIIGLSTPSVREEGGGRRIPVSVITANLRFPTKYLSYMKFTSPRL